MTNEALKLPIRTLRLTGKAENVLYDLNVRKVEDIFKPGFHIAVVFGQHYIGQKTVDDIINKFKHFCLLNGLKFPENKFIINKLSKKQKYD